MKSFRQYLKEYSILLEDKKQDHINRWLRVHSDHPLIRNNPERAKSLIDYTRSFGKTGDEHRFLTRQLLDGTYKPGEDDPTMRMILGKWRRGKKQNLVTGFLGDHTHDSVSELFKGIPELRIKTTVQARGMDELAQYHIGEIEHPQHGTLQVHHVHHSDVKDFEEYKTISAALRKTCQGGYTWCVLPKEEDSGPKRLTGYSKGSGIFFYTNQEGTPVLTHGYEDRGIVDPGNKEVDVEEGKQIFGETIKLLSGEKKVSHILARRNEQYVNSDQLQSAVEDPSFGSIPDHIDNALQSRDEYAALKAAQHHDFGNGEKHINIALKSPHESVAKAAVKLPDFEWDRVPISDALNSPHEFVQRAAVENRRFGSKPYHISYALMSPHESIARAALKRTERFGKYFGGTTYPSVMRAGESDEIDHIMSGLKSPHEFVAREALKRTDFGTSPHLFSSAFDSPHEFVARAALEDGNFGNHSYHIYYALKSPHEFVQRAVVENKYAHHRTFGGEPSYPGQWWSDHIGDALRSRYEFVQRAAVEHRRFGSKPDHITKALKSPFESVREAAKNKSISDISYGA